MIKKWLTAVESDATLPYDIDRMKAFLDGLSKQAHEVGRAEGFKEGVEAAAIEECQLCRDGMPIKKRRHKEPNGLWLLCRAQRIRDLLEKKNG